jgi:cytochrome c oxidase cbb3-type subunit I/II
MYRIGRTICVLALGFALMGSFALVGAESPGNAVRGKLVYQRYCLSCHGEAGNGAGEYTEWISPKPRDYRQGTFKWRSTPSGSLPTDADLDKTLKDGLYGTFMPTWFAIGHQSRRDVIAYIKTFSDRWEKEKPQASITIPPEPANDQASVQRGRVLYVKYQCVQCHGEKGQGDGPSAHELKDDWGNPIVPYNLTEGHIKCGDTAADIYRVFITGLSGTPMPSYADSINKDDSWDLAHFILSLGPPGPRRRPEQGP